MNWPAHGSPPRKVGMNLPGARSGSGGFSLIEMMMVIAVIAISLLLAVPSYENFTTRAKLTEALVATAPFKLEVAEHLYLSGKLPLVKQNEEYKTLRNPSKYIRLIKFRRPAKNVFYIEVWPSHRVNGSLGSKKSLLLRAHKQDDVGTITWECGTYSSKSRKIPYEYLPASCRQDMSRKGKV